MLYDFDLARGVRLSAHEFASPDVLVGAEIEALGDFVGDVFDEFTDEIRCAPAEVIDIVIAEGPDGFEIAIFGDVFYKAGMVDLFG